MDFKIIFDFLKKLSKNNNREWFEKNKDQYVQSRALFEQFIDKLHREMCKSDPSLAGLDPAKLVFRIYRDIRFSKDKTPYKKNFAAGFSPTGKGMGRPGYYVHIEPGNKSMVAVGLFMPPADYLSKIRQEIDYNGDRLEKIFSDKKFKAYYKKFWDEEALKTAPKGYAKDHVHVDWLRLKSFIVTHQFKDTEVASAKFLKNLTSAMKSGKALNDFLTEALQ